MWRRGLEAGCPTDARNERCACALAGAADFVWSLDLADPAFVPFLELDDVMSTLASWGDVDELYDLGSRAQSIQRFFFHNRQGEPSELEYRELLGRIHRDILARSAEW